MTVTSTQTAPTAAAEEAVVAAAGSVRAMAIGLWGVVGTLLGYGVLQTAIKASALFTG